MSWISVAEVREKKKKKDLLYLFKDNTEMQQNQTKTNTAQDY